MKTILLTGATGFLGSHLLEALISEGYRVVILKRTTSNTSRIDHLLNRVISYDIDKQPINLAFKQEGIDVVFHTACNYGRNQGAICDVVEDNLMFGLRVLEVAISHKVGSFFNTDTLLPDYINSYSLSKHQFTEWLKQLSNKIQCVNLRIEHIYGPKDDKNKFVSWLLDQMINSDESIKLTQGEQKRDFVYIDDVVSAYILLLSQTDSLQDWNEFDVGTNQFITMKEFINSLRRVVEESRGIRVKAELDFGAIPYREGEIMEPILNNSKLLQLGWQPKMKLDSGLERIVKEF